MPIPKRVVLIIAVVAALSGCSAPAPHSTSNVFAMKVGDCLADDNSVGGDTTVTHVPIVKCSAFHTSEVIASIKLAGKDASFPGADSVNDEADKRCNTPYETFTGATLATTTLDYTYYVPSAASWKAGDREILCVVYDPAGPVTGSLKGKGPSYPKH